MGASFRSGGTYAAPPPGTTFGGGQMQGTPSPVTTTIPSVTLESFSEPPVVFQPSPDIVQSEFKQRGFTTKLIAAVNMVKTSGFNHIEFQKDTTRVTHEF